MSQYARRHSGSQRTLLPLVVHLQFRLQARVQARLQAAVVGGVAPMQTVNSCKQAGPKRATGLRGRRSSDILIALAALAGLYSARLAMPSLLASARAVA